MHDTMSVFPRVNSTAFTALVPHSEGWDPLVGKRDTTGRARRTDGQLTF